MGSPVAMTVASTLDLSCISARNPRSPSGQPEEHADNLHDRVPFGIQAHPDMSRNMYATSILGLVSRQRDHIGTDDSFRYIRPEL